MPVMSAAQQCAAASIGWPATMVRHRCGWPCSAVSSPVVQAERRQWL